jgi:hypothetical protein
LRADQALKEALSFLQ